MIFLQCTFTYTLKTTLFYFEISKFLTYNNTLSQHKYGPLTNSCIINLTVWVTTDDKWFYIIQKKNHFS